MRRAANRRRNLNSPPEKSLVVFGVVPILVVLKHAKNPHRINSEGLASNAFRMGVRELTNFGCLRPRQSVNSLKKAATDSPRDTVVLDSPAQSDQFGFSQRG